MFSTAMYTIDAATRVSMSGGNQSASGATPMADDTSVIECATVNDVTMRTSGLMRLNGITRQRTKSK